MQVSCPHCTTRLQLNAAKLPAHSFTIKCPKCQADFTVSPTAVPSPPAPELSPLAQEDDPLGLFEENATSELPSPDSAILKSQLSSQTGVATVPPDMSVGRETATARADVAPASADWNSPSPAVAVGWTNSMPAPTVENDSNMLVTGHGSNQDILQVLAALLSLGTVAKPSVPIEQNRRRSIVICLANHDDIGAVQAAFHNQPYELTIATSPEQVTSMLQMSHQLDILLLDPNFHAHQQGGATIMRYLNMLNPARRRRVFVVVTSHSYRSMDMQAAFIHGVNLVINSGELDTLPMALSKSIQEFNNLYRAFNEASGAHPF